MPYLDQAYITGSATYDYKAVGLEVFGLKNWKKLWNMNFDVRMSSQDFLIFTINS